MPPNKLIDMHTHMFNGFYVPIEDILHHKFTFEWAVATSLGAIIKCAIEKEGPPPWGVETAWRAGAEDPDNTDLLAEILLDRVKKRLQKELLRHTPSVVAEKQGTSSLFENITGFISHQARETKAVFDPRQLSDSLTPFLIPRESMTEEKMREDKLSGMLDDLLLPPLKDKLSALKGYVDFFVKMLQDDRTLCVELIEKNYDETNRPALTVHLMMDMDPAYKKPGEPFIGAEYDFHETQIPRASELVASANGRLLGFVAFDPRRGDVGVDRCIAALDQGNIGIKVYPPLGYKPDELVSRPSLGRLYDECTRMDIPILTHCTPRGFEAWKDLGVNSDPSYWEKVLEQFPNLRLCFGHAGGGYFRDTKIYNKTSQKEERVDLKGWYCTDEDEEEWSGFGYPRKIIDFCVTYKNVYTDFSYLHDMIYNVKGEREIFKQRLKHAFFHTHGTCPFRDKIIYGTDWHMSQLVNSTQKYVEMFKRIFEEEDFKAFRDGFFFVNAVRFLNLRKYVEKERSRPTPFFSEEALSHLETLVEMASG